MKRCLTVVMGMALAMGVCLVGMQCGTTDSGRKPDTSYNPVIDPTIFTTVIDNTYLPMPIGTTFVYEGQSDGIPEVNRMYISHDTKTVIGVTCVAVYDSVWSDGNLVETTDDWYAQDSSGTVWYFGEASREVQGGEVVSTEGSWEAGVDGAKPGIIMKAHPLVGDTYRQEYYFENAEDMAEVLSLSESVTIGLGQYSVCLKSKEWTPLEPGVVEHKLYAPGVGMILDTVAEGGSGRTELTQVHP